MGVWISAGTTRQIQQVADQRAASSRDNGAEPDHRRVPQSPGPALVQLGQLRAGRPDHQQGSTFGPIGEALQERQHGVIGPVEILEHEHRRVGTRDPLEEPSPGGERFLAFARGFRLHPDEWSEPRTEPIELFCWEPMGTQRAIELRRRRARAESDLQDPGLGLHDLAEGPERDPLAVRAGSAPDARRISSGTSLDDLEPSS